MGKVIKTMEELFKAGALKENDIDAVVIMRSLGKNRVAFTVGIPPNEGGRVEVTINSLTNGDECINAAAYVLQAFLDIGCDFSERVDVIFIALVEHFVKLSNIKEYEKAAVLAALDIARTNGSCTR